MKNCKKIFAAVLAVCLCAVLLTACSKAPANSEVITGNPSGVAAEELTLTDEQMIAALTELARRTENQMLAVDPHAKVEFRVAEDGTCGFYAAGTDDDGTVTQEMEEISTGESVQAFFTSYYNAGFFDADGDLLGFPEEVPQEDMPQESEPVVDGQTIRENVTPEGGDGEIAGFPDEGRLPVEDAPEKPTGPEADNSK